jgi:hypothetical protein
MGRTNSLRHPTESAGPRSCGLAHLAAPTTETEHRVPAHPVGDPHEERASTNWWSAWIDLGGEG